MSYLKALMKNRPSSKKGTKAPSKEEEAQSPSFEEVQSPSFEEVQTHSKKVFYELPFFTIR